VVYSINFVLTVSRHLQVPSKSGRVVERSECPGSLAGDEGWGTTLWEWLR